MCSKPGGKSFTKKPEELLQPQNKAKQHSFKVVPSMCGEEVDFRYTFGSHLFLLSESTELVAYTCFCILDLASVSCS